VRAAIDSQGADAPTLPPHIARIVEKIVPAVMRVAAGSPVDAATLDSHEVGREHLRDTIAELLDSSELISVLQENNVPFEMMLYPGQRHGVRGNERQLQQWRTYLDFLDRTIGSRAS
jgi:hypothetical protein